jgi:hypothetical protein
MLLKTHHLSHVPVWLIQVTDQHLELLLVPKSGSIPNKILSAKKHNIMAIINGKAMQQETALRVHVKEL